MVRRRTKAAALASYAKQAGDEEAMNSLLRIRARATRRCGELLKQFDGRPENAKQSTADDTLISQREVAEQAGLSKRTDLSPIGEKFVSQSDAILAS